MVPEDVGKAASLVLAKLYVDLVGIEGLLEVDTNLHGNFGKNIRLHSSISSLFEEKILGLGQTEVTVGC